MSDVLAGAEQVVGCFVVSLVVIVLILIAAAFGIGYLAGSPQPEATQVEASQ